MTEPASDGSTNSRENSVDTERHKEYWRRNIRYVGILLAIWFSVSYGCGIVFAEALNAFRVPGTNFPVGFWFAQQGSIYIFVALIFFYAWRMNHIDRKFDVHED